MSKFFLAPLPFDLPQGGEFTLRGPQGRELSRTVEPRLCGRHGFSDLVFVSEFQIRLARFLAREKSSVPASAGSRRRHRQNSNNPDKRHPARRVKRRTARAKRLLTFFPDLREEDPPRGRLPPSWSSRHARRGRQPRTILSPYRPSRSRSVRRTIAF